MFAMTKWCAEVSPDKRAKYIRPGKQKREAMPCRFRLSVGGVVHGYGISSERDGSEVIEYYGHFFGACEVEYTQN